MTSRLLFIFLISLASANLESQNNIVPLKVGEFIPEVQINNLLNYPSSSAKLSDFKGKLVILDFWNKGCSSCIQAFPKMQQLQEEFQGKIQVLLVTMNSAEELKPLFKQSPIIKKVHLPSKISDTILSSLFPHFLEPYHVWIGGDGKVIATTRGYNATPEHIRDYLEGKQIGFIIPRNLEDFNMDMYKPMLQERNANLLGNLKYYSVFTKPLHSERSSGLLVDSISNNQSGMRFLDANLLFLCWNAYNFRGPFDRIIVRSKDPNRFYEPKDDNKKDEWERNNIYCYEVRMPPELYNNISNEKLTQKLLKIMRQDIENCFGIVGTIENVNLKCWVIEKISSADKLNPTGEFFYVQQDDDHFSMKNGAFALFPEAIMYANLGPGCHPIIDETGITEKIDIEINSPLTDLPALNAQLKKYGLEIKEQDREIKGLILKDEE